MKNQDFVVIVGRPNVGKSTVFNRLVGRKQALVLNQPGVTRDRIEGNWNIHGYGEVRLCDTGGVGEGPFSVAIQQSVSMALEQAAVTLLVLDGQIGIHPEDRAIIQWLLKKGYFTAEKPVMTLINKVDPNSRSHDENLTYDLMEFGISEVFEVSAEHGTGFLDLTTAVKKILIEQDSGNQQSPEEEVERVKIPKICIVGKPNVGKSTLLNFIAGKQRQVVSDIPGTTVDAVDEICHFQGRDWHLIDTAGIRRKGKTHEHLEKLSIVQARGAMDQADLAILVLDGSEGLFEQDEKIAGYIEEAGCSVIVLVNKWDQHRTTGFSKEDGAERIREQMPFIRYAPVIFGSAKEGTGLKDLGALMSDILEQRALRVATKEFSEWIRDKAEIHNPKNVKFYLCHQAGNRPPTFIFRVNQPQNIHFSLSRHLANAIREKYGFVGSPLRLHFLPRQSQKLTK